MKVVLWRESNPLANVKVAAPCSAEWRWMYGNDRVRFCNQCRLNVYNLSAMTRWEAEDLIRNTEGQLCVRFYRRADGTILTQNCPTRLRALKERVKRIRAHILGAAFSLVSFFSFAVAQKLTESLAPLSPPVVMGQMVEPYQSNIVPRSESFIRERVIFKVSPMYHANRSSRINGEAVVKIIINEGGEVESAEQIKGNPLLKEIAEEAASRWKFGPLVTDGLPTRVESQLTFRFIR
jgi:TonB family protein